MSSFQEKRLREMSHTLFFCSVQEAAKKTPLNLMFTEEDERKEQEEEDRVKKMLEEEIAKLQSAEKSNSEQGTSDQGTSEQSTSEQGTSQQGTSQQGTSQQGNSQLGIFSQLLSKKNEPAFFTWREIFDIPPTWCDLSECRLSMLVCKNKPAGCHKNWRLVIIHECMLQIFDDENEQSAIYIEDKWKDQYLATIAARKEGKDPILRSYQPKYKFRPTYKDIWTKLKSWFGFEVCDDNEPVPHQFAQFSEFNPFGNSDPQKYLLYGNVALKEDFDEEKELTERKRKADEEMEDEEFEGEMEDEEEEEMEDEEEEEEVEDEEEEKKEDVEGEEKEVEEEKEEQDEGEKGDQEKMEDQEEEEEEDVDGEKDQDMEEKGDGNQEEKEENHEEEEEEHKGEEEEHDAEVAAGLEKESDE